MVDAGLHVYEFVEIPAQPIDAADCIRTASPEPVGSVGFEGADRTDGAGVASLVTSECLPRDQLIRGTSAIGVVPQRMPMASRRGDSYPAQHRVGTGKDRAWIQHVEE
jgi:hypothetical protein